MKIYLKLKDQVANTPNPNPTYPEMPDTQSLQKAQASRNGSDKRVKKEKQESPGK